jgi:hypothetical protein
MKKKSMRCSVIAGVLGRTTRTFFIAETTFVRRRLLAACVRETAIPIKIVRVH